MAISWSTSALQYFELVPLHVMCATRRLGRTIRSSSTRTSGHTLRLVTGDTTSVGIGELDEVPVADDVHGLSIDATAADVSSP